MKSLRKPVLTAAAALALALCTLPAAAKRPKPLPDLDQARSFVLAQDLRVYTLVTMDKQSAFFVARACVYTQAFRDASGDYYVAAPGCMQSENVFSDGRTMDYDGGIWIPAKPGKPPRMYGVVGLDKETCHFLKPLLCWVAKMEVGRFKLAPGKMNADAAEAIMAALAAMPAGQSAP